MRPRLVLAICCLSLLIVGMDVTIVNVALPAIREDLDASVTELQWVTVSYTIVIASLLLLGGSTGDRFGRVRTFQTGLVIFTAASLGCSLAPSIEWLIAFRVLQGVGGSMLNPVAMSIVRNTFEDPQERARAIGVWAAMVGVSMALGPLLGGLLSEITWRAVFLVNIPIGLAAIVLTAWFVPESRAPRARRPDPVGQVLVIVGLATLTTAIIEGPDLGWGSPETLALLLVAAGSIGTLIPHELRRREPLIELRFFQSRPFAAATGIAVAGFIAFGGFLFVNTLYLQEVRGLSAVTAGLATLPIAAMTVVCAPISGRIVGARGVRIPLLVSGVAIAISGLMLVSLEPDSPIGLLLTAYVIFGLGFGTLNPPITNTAVSGMPASQAGVAAAVASTSRQVGQTLGVATFGAVVTAGLTDLDAQLTAASHAGWWLVAALGALIAGLGWFASTPAADASAQRTAARFADPAGPAAPQPEVAA